MATMYCALCRRPVEAGRQVGVGSVVLAFLTGGLSLLAIPFYAKRCSICKSTAVTMRDPETGIVATGNGVAVQLAELKQRLTFAEEQLEAAETELHRTRTERDFYRQLVGDPAPERSDPTNQSRR